ncbi:O-antigen polymerase [Caulobacter vibrioides]|uniref:O-antigen polymerase n=1 Tax=Caulobacter vibrioides TaxID=155892 RepID=UPI000BB4C35A|nr:O-antigen polymerase [Caulobacter vibrioides]ATC23458.1 O-antigen polysaccharide polymerase Wzy [Caulobacter vibrioides]PLR11955.1 O-antigen polysaccharide polymerase Wzy [Caulobacter vibrioides]
METTNVSREKRFPTLRAFLALWLIGTFGPLIVLTFDKDKNFLIEALKLHDRVFVSVVYLCIAALCVFSGYIAAVRASTGRYAGPTHSVARAPARRAPLHWNATLVIWILAITSMILLMAISPGGVLGTANALMSKVRNATKFQTIIYFLLPFVVFQACFLSISAIQSGDKRKVWVTLTIVLVTAALSLAVGSRLNAVMSLLVPAIYFATNRGVKLAPLIACFALAIMLVYAGDLMRSTAQGRDLREASGSAAATFMSSYSIVDPMAVVTDLRERISPKATESTVTLVRWMLPSSIVGSKEPIGPIVARYVYYGDVLGGVTFGLFGEFYYYYGPIGLIVLSTLFGAALGVLTPRSGERSVLGAAYTVCIATLLFSSIRDGLFIDLLNMFTLIFICWVNISIANFSASRQRLLKERAERAHAAKFAMQQAGNRHD